MYGISIGGCFALYYTVSMSHEEERQLVERAKTDPAAFGEIFDRYYDRLFSYALHRTGSVAVAEDVVAETFLKAFNKLWQFTWRGAPFSAWLYRIAGNEVLMHFRRRDTATASLEAMLEADASLEPKDPNDLRDELIAAEEEYAKSRLAQKAIGLLQQLPAHYAEALTLRYMEEKSVAEVAAILDKPEGTVKSLLSRGIDRLRDLMVSQPDGLSGILQDE